MEVVKYVAYDMRTDFALMQVNDTHIPWHTHYIQPYIYIYIHINRPMYVYFYICMYISIIIFRIFNLLEAMNIVY